VHAVSATSDAIEAAFRAEYGLVLASLVRSLRDIDLAEDALSEAMMTAMAAWPRLGVPDNPAAWLMTTARRKAIDRIRRQKNLDQKTRELQVLAELEARAVEFVDDGSIPDERLRLIFTCCHPILSLEAQVALTLKTVGGLEVGDIAAAFLVSETTMYQRLVRAKRRIKEARVPYEVPPGHDLPERVGAVMAVIYLIFTEGYSSRRGGRLMRLDLADEAIRLGSVLAALMPDEPEVLGLLALMKLQDSRRAARTAPDGSLVLMADQDRTQWDHAAIAEGSGLVARALRMGRPGPFQIEAAIAAVHCETRKAGDTDWRQIAALYGELLRHRSTSIVALNHAVAVGMWRGPEAALSLLDRIEGLESNHLFHAARAEFLFRGGRVDAAETAFRRALAVVENETERTHLERRIAEITGR
jgi:RNA polymerase sigma-70 factor (ECF subfamily)